MRNFRTLLATGSLPGFEAGKTYAAWPVWSGSTTKEIHFQPMPRKAAVKAYRRAEDYDRRTRQPGKHGGALGHMALRVLNTMLFGFLDYASGRLDPSYAAIARKANVCQRTVANALAKLRSAGVLHWQRRCAEGRRDDGRFMLTQETNAYAVLPETQWRGYQPPAEPPAPMPGTWGDHPALPSVVAQAAAERQQGGTLHRMVDILASDPTDALARALARLGNALAAKP